MSSANSTSAAGYWALFAGCVSAALTWLSLTKVPLLSQPAVLMLTLACAVGCVAAARRSRGAQRRLAVLGAGLAILPLVVVIAFLSVSDG